MSSRPGSLSERPGAPLAHADVLSDVLATLRFTTLLFARFELSAPWALRVPHKATSSFYVVSRGNLRLTVDRIERPYGLSAGDVVLIPHGAAHTLDDGARSALAPRDFISTAGLAGPFASPLRFGGDGPASTIISGCFRLEAGLRHPWLDAFPRAVHLTPKSLPSSPSLAATVQLLSAESESPAPGKAFILGRLADVLLVQALRVHTATTGPAPGGWQALADPAIGAALGLIHGRPGEPWTVQSLAAAVGLSRSSFAARFHELVGAPPMQYLAEWRMARAAQWLSETHDSIARVAERAGYDSAAAFNKAFTRWRGIGPGAYRRLQVSERAEIL
jgi:AraC-like DNA-binding protein